MEQVMRPPSERKGACEMRRGTQNVSATLKSVGPYLSTRLNVKNILGEEAVGLPEALQLAVPPNSQRISKHWINTDL